MISSSNGKKYTTRRNYRIHIKSYDTDKLANFIQPRKAALLDPAKKRANHGVFKDNEYGNIWYVRSIQQLEDITDNYEEQFMYDLEVEEDHSYIVNNIAVHNCFPYAELDERTGKFSRVIVHNPDYVRVRANVLADEPVISLQPDDVLRRIVMSNRVEDRQLRQQLDPTIQHYIMKNENIPLDNFNVSHLKMMSSPYDLRGTSIITCVFKDLMLYDRIREAKFAQADNFINPITLVKLGDEAGQYRPTDADLQEFQEAFEEAQYDPDFKLITHGAVSVEKVSNAGTTLDVTADLDLILKNIMMGLFTPEAVISAEGPTYATASVGLEVLQDRYLLFRQLLEKWLKLKIFAPIAKIQDFYKYEDGKKRLIIPEIRWNKINLKNTSDYVATVVGLLEEHVSTQTLFEILDLDYGEEITKRRQEMIDKSILERELSALQGMTVENLRSMDPDKPISVPPGVALLPGEVAEQGGGAGGDLGDLLQMPAGAPVGGGGEINVGEPPPTGDSAAPELEV